MRFIDFLLVTLLPASINSKINLNKLVPIDKICPSTKCCQLSALAYSPFLGEPSATKTDKNLRYKSISERLGQLQSVDSNSIDLDEAFNIIFSTITSSKSFKIDQNNFSVENSKNSLWKISKILAGISSTNHDKLKYETQLDYLIELFCKRVQGPTVNVFEVGYLKRRMYMSYCPGALKELLQFMGKIYDFTNAYNNARNSKPQISNVSSQSPSSTKNTKILLTFKIIDNYLNDTLNYLKFCLDGKQQRQKGSPLMTSLPVNDTFKKQKQERKFNENLSPRPTKALKLHVNNTKILDQQISKILLDQNNSSSMFRRSSLRTFLIIFSVFGLIYLLFYVRNAYRSRVYTYMRLS